MNQNSRDLVCHHDLFESRSKSFVEVHDSPSNSAFCFSRNETVGTKHVSISVPTLTPAPAPESRWVPSGSETDMDLEPVALKGRTMNKVKRTLLLAKSAEKQAVLYPGPPSLADPHRGSSFGSFSALCEPLAD